MTGLRIATIAALICAGALGPALAQTPPRTQGGAPSGTALPGGAPSGPLQIDSDRLEVRDREKRAIFAGNVVAKRGDMIVRASTMTVFYDQEGEAARPQPAAAPGAEGQQIRRIEMAGPVFFCQRDQTARGERAVYERANETLEMTGNVVLTQGESVISGPRLVVNMRTSLAQVMSDPARPGERVRSILVPNNERNAAAPAAAPGGNPCAPPSSAPPPQPNARPRTPAR